MYLSTLNFVLYKLGVSKFFTSRSNRIMSETLTWILWDLVDGLIVIATWSVQPREILWLNHEIDATETQRSGRVSKSNQPCVSWMQFVLLEGPNIISITVLLVAQKYMLNPQMMWIQTCTTNTKGAAPSGGTSTRTQHGREGAHATQRCNVMRSCWNIDFFIWPFPYIEVRTCAFRICRIFVDVWIQYQTKQHLSLWLGTANWRSKKVVYSQLDGVYAVEHARLPLGLAVGRLDVFELMARCWVSFWGVGCFDHLWSCLEQVHIFG